MTETPPRYRVLGSLGKGGMGEVFLAHDTQLGRQVAVKFLTEILEADPTARERLQREARSAAALDHPYICKIYEIAAIEGRTGIVMEHVSGETLQTVMARAPISAERALEIAGEIAEALETAHLRGVVHRDLKPSNVMLTDQGHVKVMDFGLAKAIDAVADDPSLGETIGPLTESGTRVGTPGYMAPEQLLGSQADQRSDIFAFGIVLYELMAGVHPFQRASRSGTMAAILRDTPAPVTQYQGTLPESTKNTFDRLLAKEPDQRPQSFVDVRVQLRRMFDDISGSRPAPLLEPAQTSAPTSGVVRTPYVGRETERAEIHRLLDQAVDGHGATVLIGGEPGVGKTRFTEELTKEARERGCLTLVGHCYETEGTPPFIPYVEILERSAKIVPRQAFREALGDSAAEVAKIMPELRQIFPDIPPPVELPPDQQRRFMFNAYQAFSERSAKAMPIVTVLEDLHWADEPTLLLMQHLAQHLAPLPRLMVGTYRDVELDVTRPFAKILESLVRERLATRITLRRLPATDVEQMLEVLSGEPPPAPLAQAVYHETEGNPFFVEEVFQHLKEEGRLFDAKGRWKSDLDIDELQVPEGVRLVIGRRLERVSDDARKALTVAAVIGRNFDLSVLEAAATIDNDSLLDALEEAERAQLISSAAKGREIQYTFAHELIRQTLHANLSLPRRQRLHLRVADAIESAHAGAPDKQAAALAHHCYQAGAVADTDKTLQYLTLAAKQAITAAAFEDAVKLLTTALSFERLDEPAKADLMFDRGSALRSLAQADDAIADWEAALAIYLEQSDAASVAATMWPLGMILLWQDRRADALALAERALQAVPDQATPERARGLAIAGACRALVGDYAGHLPLIGAAREIAEALGNLRLLGQVLDAEAGLSWTFLKITPTIEAGTAGAEAAKAAGDIWIAAEALSNLGFGLAHAGSVNEAQRVAEEAEQLAKDVGHDGAAANAVVVQMEVVAMNHGDLDVLDRLAGSIEATYGRAGPWTWIARLWQSRVRFGKGDWDEAVAICDNISWRKVPEPWREWARGWKFLLKAYQGDHSWLHEYAERRDALFTEQRALFAGDRGLAMAATEALALIGERQQAHLLYPILIDLINDGLVRGFSLIEMHAGISAACGHEWSLAQQHFETALRQSHDLPHKLAQPDVRRWYALMLLDRNDPGNRDKAKTLLTEATEMYRALGMRKHVELAASMLAKN